MPLSKHVENLRQHQIDASAAYGDLYGVDHEGRIFKGYALYLALTQKILFLWPLFPILYLGQLLKIGPLLYGLIARHRIKLFGVCEIPKLQTSGSEVSQNFGASHIIASNQQLLLKAFLPVFALCLIAFIVRMPLIVKGIGGAPAQVSIQWIKNAMLTFGLCEIDVFNHTDLHQSINFYTLKRLQANGFELIPFNGLEGERLSWHHSDILYFGNSVPWRRSHLNGPHVCDLRDIDTHYLSQLFKIDLNRNKLKFAQYEVDYYFQPLPSINRGVYAFSTHPIEHTCTIHVDSNMHILKKVVLSHRVGESVT